MSDRAITRIRHETRRRKISVTSVYALTPRMRRIEFTARDLFDFVSASPDDHVKLFFPHCLDTVESPSPCMRDYTLRSFDTKQGRLVIDFALHEAGPATSWAVTAKVGDTLDVGGPRGSAVLSNNFDWYVFIGDETSLPAIGRFVEEAKPGAQVATAVVIDSDAEVQQFQTHAVWTPIWSIRDGARDDAALLRAALCTTSLSRGAGFVWIAAETQIARALRSYIVNDRQHPRELTKASGYWSRGKADTHESIDG